MIHYTHLSPGLQELAEETDINDVHPIYLQQLEYFAFENCGKTAIQGITTSRLRIVTQNYDGSGPIKYA